MSPRPHPAVNVVGTAALAVCTTPRINYHACMEMRDLAFKERREMLMPPSACTCMRAFVYGRSQVCGHEGVRPRSLLYFPHSYA
eukprot:5103729-Pleurochrysis_carterae.AAC.2